MSLKIACAQLNLRVGDMAGNVERIVDAAARAAGQGADILLTPELSLCGYLPGDNLLRPAFQQQVDTAVERIRQASQAQPDLHWVVGYPVLRDGRRYSAAGVFQQGRLLLEYMKAELPNYGVFDEKRYFSPQPDVGGLTVKGVRCALQLCEDTWFSAAPARARAAGAELILSLNASPFQSAKGELRADILRRHVCAQGMAIVACQLVGGQDELVFDGQSLALNAQGQVVARAAAFVEDLLLVEVERAADETLMLAGRQEVPLAPIPEIYQALVLGIRDYIGKNGFGGVLLGLSGGIDSALTLALAVDALGAERVRTVMMPSPYTADISLADAQEMASRLGVKYEVLPIQPCVEAFRSTLAPLFAGLPEDLTEENIQARIRGTLLMALSNKSGWLVLATGNKSELATGYCTLYGDMVGGFAPLKDVLKTVVYQLSVWRNEQSPAIPERIISRPPSAELRPDQTDQDSLPPYDVLDRIIRGYMEEDRPASDLVAEGLPADVVNQVIRLLRTAEYKRQQGAVGPKITPRAFGRDWRYPITSAFRETVDE